MVRRLNLYRSYSFKDRDPVIDELRTIIKDEGAKYSQVHEMSGVSITTLNNWFGPKGKTKRPQSATTEAVGRSLGYKRVWKHFARVSLKEKGSTNGKGGK